jgi:hypothetical protein
MLVLAVDVGIRNLAICAMDTAHGIVHWANEPLSIGAYQPQHNVQYVHEFLARNAALFALADEIVVEKQMRVNMRIIEAVIHSRFFDKCKVVHPRTIKAAFGIGRGNYALNKKASVDFVQARLQSFEEPHWRNFFASAKKRDDLADAYIMALFFSGGGRVSKPCSTLAQGRMAAMTSPSPPSPSTTREASEPFESSTFTPCLPCGSNSRPHAMQMMNAPTSSNS